MYFTGKHFEAKINTVRGEIRKGRLCFHDPLVLPLQPSFVWTRVSAWCAVTKWTCESSQLLTNPDKYNAMRFHTCSPRRDACTRWNQPENGWVKDARV